MVRPAAAPPSLGRAPGSAKVGVSRPGFPGLVDAGFGDGDVLGIGVVADVPPPVRTAATAVEPEPRNGSSTTSPTYV